jgi:sulfonate transport system substrate-binding protein
MSAPAATRLRLGAHPSNKSLHALSQRPEVLAESGVDVDLFAYNAGNQTVPLMHAGALDVTGTGATPPLLAMAEGLDVVMIAMSNRRDDEPGGVLVRADSPLREVAGLAGRSLAIMPTSWHPHYVAALLRAHGMSWGDLRVVELNTPTARDALLRGGADAWVATGPDAQALLDSGEVRVLATIAPHLSNRSVLWATRAAAETRGDEIAAVLRALAVTDAGTGRSWHPVDAEFVREQAEGAALLHAAGVLPALIDPAAAVVTVDGF